MHFLDKSQPQGLTDSPKGVCFQVRRIKVVNLGVLKVTQKHLLLVKCNFLISNFLINSAQRPVKITQKECVSKLRNWGYSIKQDLKVTQKHLLLLMGNFLI